MAAKAKTTDTTLNEKKMDRCAETFQEALTAKDDQSNLVTRCVKRLQDEYEGFEISAKEIGEIAKRAIDVPTWAESTKKQRASNVRKVCRTYAALPAAIEKLKAHKSFEPSMANWHGCMRLTTALEQTKTTTGKFQPVKAVAKFFENGSKKTKRTKDGERKKALKHLRGILDLQKNFIPAKLRDEVAKLIKAHEKELAGS